MIKSVVISPYAKEDKFSLQIEGRTLNCGQGIKGVSIFPLTKEDLLILADEIRAQMERK